MRCHQTAGNLLSHGLPSTARRMPRSVAEPESSGKVTTACVGNNPQPTPCRGEGAAHRLDGDRLAPPA
jgi:hypothetical protein